jgi:hypothetical protein
MTTTRPRRRPARTLHVVIRIRRAVSRVDSKSTTVELALRGRTMSGLSTPRLYLVARSTVANIELASRTTTVPTIFIAPIPLILTPISLICRATKCTKARDLPMCNRRFTTLSRIKLPRLRPRTRAFGPKDRNGGRRGTITKAQLVLRNRQGRGRSMVDRRPSQGNNSTPLLRLRLKTFDAKGRDEGRRRISLGLWLSDECGARRRGTLLLSFYLCCGTMSDLFAFSLPCFVDPLPVLLFCFLLICSCAIQTTVVCVVAKRLIHVTFQISSICVIRGISSPSTSSPSQEPNIKD